MTYTFGPVCTCGQPYWSIYAHPCAVHGYGTVRTYPTKTTTSLYGPACSGRHCAHDTRCFGYTVTCDGA